MKIALNISPNWLSKNNMEVLIFLTVPRYNMGLIGRIFERHERDVDSSFIWLEMLASKLI